ncbi:hypothetical protein BD560DRAFT_441817 [Blakeslea trispora]|nr:hypothetical protein BD560DRAFT_441817 [Blakeslea trispora]
MSSADSESNSQNGIPLVTKEIQSDEATSSEMEHPCKHEHRHEDTRRKKTTSSKVGKNSKFKQKEIRRPLKA